MTAIDVWAQQPTPTFLAHPLYYPLLAACVELDEEVSALFLHQNARELFKLN